MERIYCDHAATTPLSDVAWAAMEPFLREQFGNASEPHWAGREARAGLDDARATAAGALGVAPAELIFTGGASEADNLAVLGRLGDGPGRIVASPFEHPAVWLHLESLAERGYEIVFAQSGRDGRVPAAEFERHVRPGDLLCCCIWGNNVTGVVQPIAEIAGICAERGVPLHVDAVQACACVPVDVGALPGAVTVAAAAHKLGGPKGVGLLCGRGLDSLDAVIHGGPHERGLRPGTENVAGASGFAAALAHAQAGEARDPRRRALRDAYEAALAGSLERVRPVGAETERLPGHSLLLVDDVRGATLVSLLDEQGIAAAANSACASASARPSHVLMALGLSEDEARSALRLSFGELNDAAQVPRIVAAVVDAVTALRVAAAAA